MRRASSRELGYASQTVGSVNRLCDSMWVSFDPRERSICGLATVVGVRGAMVGGASKSCKTSPGRYAVIGCKLKQNANEGCNSCATGV